MKSKLRKKVNMHKIVFPYEVTIIIKHDFIQQ